MSAPDEAGGVAEVAARVWAGLRADHLARLEIDARNLELCAEGLEQAGSHHSATGLRADAAAARDIADYLRRAHDRPTGGWAAMSAPDEARRVVDAVAALATVVRDGELSPEQRELLVTLLRRLGTAVTLVPNGRRHYPDDPYQAAVYEAGCWLGVAADTTALLATVGPACLWCGCSPAFDVVYGDRVCAGCYREHRAEVES